MRSSRRRRWLRRVAGLALLSGVGITLTAPASSAGYVATITNASDTAATNPYFTCAATDAATANSSNAFFEYPLTEASGATTAIDASAAKANGVYTGSMTSSATTPIGCKRDAGGAYVLDGSTSYVTCPTLIAVGPSTFSLVVWFKTTVKSGKLIGMGSSLLGLSLTDDRTMYITSTGAVAFGIVNAGVYRTAISPATTYANGSWHQAVGTISPATGLSLYLDGSLVATAAYLAPAVNVGYWRVGYDTQMAFPSIGADPFFTGSMRFAAVYATALSASEVAAEYAAGT